jgi:hypothetical protein
VDVCGSLFPHATTMTLMAARAKSHAVLGNLRGCQLIVGSLSGVVRLT